jgi:ABC-type Na+ efflux pump permease subunit
MHKVLRIAKRDYMATVRTKGFIIGLLLAPLMMGGGMIVFAISKDRVDTDDKTPEILTCPQRISGLPTPRPDGV